MQHHFVSNAARDSVMQAFESRCPRCNHLVLVDGNVAGIAITLCLYIDRIHIHIHTNHAHTYTYTFTYTYTHTHKHKHEQFRLHSDLCVPV